MLSRILTDRLWGDTDFFLIDVGASGGIERHWSVFADRVRAIGFEPLLAEAERLQQRAAGTRIRYEAAFVTCREFDRLFPPALRNDRIASKNNDPFQRVSAVRAQELMRMNYAESVFNLGAPAVYTDRFVVLDDFIPAADHPSIDFVKIDTDGHDFEVLLGTDAILRSGGVLGMSIEAQFHGAVGEYANTFANIDRFMREHGFSLFDLEVYRYSRAALPAPFVYDIPAQTTSGQVLWGEAIYFRDLAYVDYGRTWAYEITRERVLKLAALYELFGLPDCAAELLVNRRPVVEPDAEALLDLLASPETGVAGAYAEYITTFERDPQALYRGRRRAAEPPAQVVEPQAEQPSPGSPETVEPVDDHREAMSAEIARLRRRVSTLKEKTADLLDRVKRRDEQIEQLTKQGAR
jgi:FkbM family methyltransferase